MIEVERELQRMLAVEVKEKRLAEDGDEEVGRVVVARVLAERGGWWMMLGGGVNNTIYSLKKEEQLCLFTSR